MLSEKPWKLDAVVRLLFGIFICWTSSMFILELIQHLHGKPKLDESSLFFLMIATLGLHGSILFVTAIFMWSQRLKWSEAFGLSSSAKWLAILLGICTAIVFLPIGMILQQISIVVLSLLHLKGPDQPAVVTLQKIHSQDGRIYMGLLTVLIAPAAEEILFRGILYPAIKQFGYPRLALWGTSLAFAAIHMTPTIFVPLTVLALFLALLYEKTGNLLAPITAHAFFNGIGIIQIYYGEYLGQKLSEWIRHLR